MNTNEKAIKKWLDIEMSKCPAFILNRLTEKTIYTLLSKEIDLNFNYYMNHAFAKQVFDSIKIEGSTPDDYKYRYIQTTLGEMITSIRFVGGDLNKPAVYLIHKDFELKDTKDIKLIGETIKKHYAIFKPKRFRWYSSTIETDLIEAHDFITGDLIYLAEFIDYLKEQPLPKNFNKVSLHSANSLSWYSDYQKGFDEIYKKWPAFIEMAQVESKETLNELIEKKLLFEIEIEGKWAGIIAANSGSDYFFNGYYIVEEFLTENFRGKKLASSVQRHLINKLTSNSNEMLFGTIHYDNPASLRTALSAKRKAIGMYIFADL